MGDMDYHYELLRQPGLHLSNHEQASLKQDLRSLGTLCLHPLPNYQVFSDDPGSFDDKIVVTAHRINGTKRQLVGFVATVLLDISFEGVESPVLHGGLTVVHPAHRQQGLPVALFARCFVDAVTCREGTIWVTNLSGLPRTLSHFYAFVDNVFPAPSRRTPSPEHVQVARTIAERHRSKLLIASSATFDEGSFTFRGSNASEEALAFRKSEDDASFAHANKTASDFYHSLLRDGSGDEVLQVGTISRTHLMQFLEQKRFEGDQIELRKFLGID
ncbi:hypothetical protein LTR10_021396 [Elasticomyces elasticus]|nr:hypothetical protein LTR10_021396 [Elasticomyces elasticus]